MEAYLERHNGSPPTLEFFDSTLFLFYCYMHDRQCHFLLDIDLMAERCLCGLHFHVCQCHDWCWIEYGTKTESHGDMYRTEPNNPIIRWTCHL